MKKIKCPTCQKELEQDNIQYPYCRYRFKIMPKRINSPENNEMRLDGYLVSDIRDYLIHTEEDTLEQFRKTQSRPEFNPPTGFGGSPWFAKRSMFDISLWLIVLNMTAVSSMAAIYGWIHKGGRSLPYDTDYMPLFLLIILALEFYPLGRMVDRMFRKHAREVLDLHGCGNKAEEENSKLKKMLTEDSGLSAANSLIILGLDLLLMFFCKRVTAAIFLYFSYTR